MKPRNTVIIMISLLLLVCPMGAAGQDILLYANNYTDSLNIALAPIGMNLMGWLTGLDYPNEWVEYNIEPLSFGTYEIRMAVRGTENVEYHLELTLIDIFGEEQQTIPFDFIGLGFGSCSCNILTVGGDEIGMHSPSYKARLTMHSTGELWIYSFNLPVLTSSTPNSWGDIKSLFRD